MRVGTRLSASWGFVNGNRKKPQTIAQTTYLGAETQCCALGLGRLGLETWQGLVSVSGLDVSISAIYLVHSGDRANCDRASYDRAAWNTSPCVKKSEVIDAVGGNSVSSRPLPGHSYP